MGVAQLRLETTSKESELRARRLHDEGPSVTRMRFSGPFLDELAELVESFPGVGSSLLEPLLVRAFGRGCLKVSAVGYDVIYERSGEGDEDDRGNGEGDETVSVLGIIKQRRIR